MHLHAIFVVGYSLLVRFPNKEMHVSHYQPSLMFEDSASIAIVVLS